MKNNIGKQKLISKMATTVVPFMGLLVAVVFFQITCDNGIVNTRSMRSILNEAFTYLIGSVGILFVMSQGNMDMSIGGVVGLSMAFAAKASAGSLLLIVPVAILIAMMFGLINGFLVAKMKIPSFVATVAVSYLTRGWLTFYLIDGSASVPVSFNLESAKIKYTFLIVYLIIGFILFEYTRFGKYSRSIGAKMEAARQAGVNVDRMRIFAYLFSGFTCGIIATFNLSRTGTASTVSAQNLEFQLLLAMMLGGFSVGGGWIVRYRKLIIGAILSAVITGGLISMGLHVFMQQLVKGIIFIIAVTISFDRNNVVFIK